MTRQQVSKCLTGQRQFQTHLFPLYSIKGPIKHISLLNNHSVASHNTHTKYVSLESTFLRGYKYDFCSAEGTKYYQNFNITPILTAQVKFVFLHRVSGPCKGWLINSWKEQILLLNLLVTCNRHVRYQVLIVVTLRIQVSWDVMLCHSVSHSQHFEKNVVPSPTSV
jgi:hypothetical protein